MSANGDGFGWGQRMLCTEGEGRGERTYHEHDGAGGKGDATTDVVTDHLGVKVVGECDGGDGVAPEVGDMLFHGTLVEIGHEKVAGVVEEYGDADVVGGGEDAGHVGVGGGGEVDGDGAEGEGGKGVLEVAVGVVEEGVIEGDEAYVDALRGETVGKGFANPARSACDYGPVGGGGAVLLA